MEIRLDYCSCEMGYFIIFCSLKTYDTYLFSFYFVFADNMWRMTGFLKTMALLFLCPCTDSRAHSIGKCKRACTYITYFNNDRVCKECAEDPPIDYNICDFVCGKTHVNRHNYIYLDSICEKYFKKGTLMHTMCAINCSFDPKVRYYRLCKGCEKYGHYLMDF